MNLFIEHLSIKVFIFIFGISFSRIHTGVPQGSKMSPTLFSIYLADIPRPTKPVKRICYADDITVIDICTKVDSNHVHPRPKAGQYSPKDQDL